jgi:hypothetical protein
MSSSNIKEAQDNNYNPEQMFNLLKDIKIFKAYKYNFLYNILIIKAALNFILKTSTDTFLKIWFFPFGIMVHFV